MSTYRVYWIDTTCNFRGYSFVETSDYDTNGNIIPRKQRAKNARRRFVDSLGGAENIRVLRVVYDC